MISEKKLIDEKTVKGVKKKNSAILTVIITLLGIAGVFVMFVAPFPLNLIMALIFWGVGAFFIISRVRNGALEVYFMKRPVTDKKVRETTNDEEGIVEHYCVIFGDKESHELQSRYDSIRIGDMFYVMYDARNNELLRIYSVDEYDIDPSLDIREYTETN